MGYIDPLWLVSELIRVGEYALVTPGIINMSNFPKPNWCLGWFKPGSTRRSMIGGFNTWEPVLVYGDSSRRVWQDSINLPDVVNHTDDGKFHKCPKPLKLMTWIIQNFSDKGDVVIDFTAGSGTSCKAAKMLGRHYLAFEIDPDTAERARQRVQNTQPPLLIPEPEQLELQACNTLPQ